VLINNITESKQNEEKLRFQADLLCSVNEAIIAVNENGNISYWNKVAEDIFGWSASEIFGADIIQLIQKNVLNPHQEIETEITQNGCYNGEIICKRKDDTIIVIDIHCKVVNNRQSEFNGLVVSARDNTKQKQLEKKLSNLSENLFTEVNILKRLHQISTKFIQYHNDSQKLYDNILDAAIELTNASKGNLLIFNEEKGYLENVAQSGFSKDFLQQFEAISQGKGSHGLGFRNKARLIVEDVSKSIIFNETKDLDVILNRNIHSMQATPLISSAGIFIGMLSTYYKTAHEFNEGELRTLDLLARQAADAVERNKSREELDKSK
jgi:PAS domain S-box-containing protein